MQVSFNGEGGHLGRRLGIGGRGGLCNFACILMVEKGEHKEFAPSLAHLVKHPLTILALVPKDITLFAARAAAKTVMAPLDQIKLLMQAIFNELCKMLDLGKPSFTPKKGKPSVVMFVGLQGKLQHVQNMHITIRKKVGSLEACSCVCRYISSWCI